MTSPRVESDLLMLLASTRRSPEAPVSEARSLPARSIKHTLRGGGGGRCGEDRVDKGWISVR